MKVIISSVVFLGLAVAVPAIPVFMGDNSVSAIAENKSEKSPEIKEFIPNETAEVSFEPYHVLNCSTGNINEVSVRDYVIGAVAAEMPASFEKEALKAQAVVSHTYAERQRNLQKKAPDSALGTADFSDDPNKYQGFFTDEKIHHYFGDNYDTHYNKIAEAVDEVLPYIITYDDEPIIAAFHSMSSGKTESAENVWGTAVDYLVPAESKSDKDAPNYVDETNISKDFVQARLEKVFQGVQLGDSAEKWIKVQEKSKSGTVLKVTVGDLILSGNDLRTAFGLRSADFDVDFKDDEFIFTTRGYGHGVGMSQYGANYMAQKGKDWEDIIDHYYADCTIAEVDVITD